MTAGDDHGLSRVVTLGCEVLPASPSAANGVAVFVCCTNVRRGFVIWPDLSGGLTTPALHQAQLGITITDPHLQLSPLGILETVVLQFEHQIRDQSRTTASAKYLASLRVILWAHSL